MQLKPWKLKSYCLIGFEPNLEVKNRNKKVEFVKGKETGEESVFG